MLIHNMQDQIFRNILQYAYVLQKFSEIFFSDHRVFEHIQFTSP